MTREEVTRKEVMLRLFAVTVLGVKQHVSNIC